MWDMNVFAFFFFVGWIPLLVGWPDRWGGRPIRFGSRAGFGYVMTALAAGAAAVITPVYCLVFGCK